MVVVVVVVVNSRSLAFDSDMVDPLGPTAPQPPVEVSEGAATERDVPHQTALLSCVSRKSFPTGSRRNRASYTPAYPSL